MNTNRIEQLEIALEIERACAAGTHIEWEWKTSDGGWLPVKGKEHGMPIGRIYNGHEIRLKPWRLGREVNGHKLPDGAEWHRQDFTADDLPPEYRPHLLGECDYTGDEFFSDLRKAWVVIEVPSAAQSDNGCLKRRTTRAIPTSKPKSRIVDLEPCDIEPGSVVRLPGWAEGLWWAVVSVHGVNTGVSGRASSPISYAELRRDGWLIHRPSKPGVWERCEKEVTE